MQLDTRSTLASRRRKSWTGHRRFPEREERWLDRFSARDRFFSAALEEKPGWRIGGEGSVIQTDGMDQAGLETVRKLMQDPICGIPEPRRLAMASVVSEARINS